METNEIIQNSEEIIETAAEEIADQVSGNAMHYAATFGLGALVGIFAYRYAIRPLWSKLKDRKTKAVTIEVEETEAPDTEEEEESKEEA